MPRLSRTTQTRSIARVPHQRNRVVLAKSARHGVPLSKRARGEQSEEQTQFLPPEDWYEADKKRSGGYKIIVQPPGSGYRHVLSPEEIRRRLGVLPRKLLSGLDIIQLSRMTRKKQSFPCYGMQWDRVLYLYPIETELVEYYARPPRPAQKNEARMFGGRWLQGHGSDWKLVWTERAIKDFYLNNILIHELGHLLDDRNTSYIDRERFAEWFAIEYGYKPSRRYGRAKRAAKKIVRRHHG